MQCLGASPEVLGLPWQRCLVEALCPVAALGEKFCSQFAYALSSGKHPEHWQELLEPGDGRHDICSTLQATWAFVRAAVPLLKQVVGGKVELASQQVAPQLCCALARLCGQSTQGGRAFSAHIFKECKKFK